MGNTGPKPGDLKQNGPDSVDSHLASTGVSPTENERLAALHAYDILDTAQEAAFDDFALLAARICNAPIALISLVDQHRQWFKAAVGLERSETPIEDSICAEAIRQPGLFVVPDTARDGRFSGNRLVTGEPHIRFYAGAPLQTQSGLRLGTLCVLDRTPRPLGLTGEQAQLLEALARQVMLQLNLRRDLETHRRTTSALADLQRRTTDILESIPDPFYVLGRDWRIVFANNRALELWQLPQAVVIGTDFWELFPARPGLRQSPGGALQERVMHQRQPERAEFLSAMIDAWCEMTVSPTSDGAISVHYQNITSRKQNETALMSALAEKDLLMQEVHHRVKNSLQIVQNLLSLQARSAGDTRLAGLLEQSSSRIHTIASMHDRLYREGSVSDLAIEPYLRGLIDDLGRSLGSAQHGRTITLEADPVIWPAGDVPALGLVLTELVTNALKHGAGPVRVSLRQSDPGQAVLTVADEGNGLPPDFDPAGAGKQGLGMRLILRLLRGRGGTFELLPDLDHTCFRATLPVTQATPDDPSA